VDARGKLRAIHTSALRELFSERGVSFPPLLVAELPRAGGCGAERGRLSRGPVHVPVC
jgi:hypothetical protein